MYPRPPYHAVYRLIYSQGRTQKLTAVEEVGGGGEILGSGVIYQREGQIPLWKFFTVEIIFFLWDPCTLIHTYTQAHAPLVRLIYL